MTPISPVRKANTPETPESSEGIASARLLKYVSPPRCPNAIKIQNTAKNKKNAIISPIDHLPIMVLGLTLFIFYVVYFVPVPPGWGDRT